MTSPDNAGSLKDLLERVEKAEGADRWLDADLCEALFGVSVDRKGNPAAWGVWVQAQYVTPEGGDISAEAFDRLAPYTASLDAALALVERKGWQVYGLDASIPGRWCWTLWAPERTPEDGPGFTSAAHANRTLAVLAALLRALIAQETEHVG